MIYNKHRYINNDQEFQIVRILCTWNKIFSVFYVTVADIRNVFMKYNNINKINIALDTLAEKWQANISSGEIYIYANK